MNLSILIPARNEMFLARTIEDIIEHAEDKTEVIAVLDGAWTDPPIAQHPMVTVVYLPTSVGQRAGTNIAARLARGKYVMKVDAHCSFDQGFDRKMVEFFERMNEDMVAVPVMRNLWAFDWKCYACGWKKYQGPTPQKCEACGRTDKMRRKMIWQGKPNPQSVSYSFDAEPHFQYFNEYKQRPEYQRSVTEHRYSESMSLQGSCFMATRDNYWRWELSDERLGNWGNQGIELACAAWLSGGRVLVNHDTWYAHMFRTQGGDFGFPWENKGKETAQTKNAVWDKFLLKKHPTQIHPVSWLVERFWPVNGWTDEQLQNLKKQQVV